MTIIIDIAIGDYHNLSALYSTQQYTHESWVWGYGWEWETGGGGWHNEDNTNNKKKINNQTHDV